MALTDKQEIFCKEYLKDLNATQAAIRAGYSDKSANRTASENLSKPDIQKRIAELKSQRNEELRIDAVYVLKRLVEIDQMDVIDILNDDMTVKPITDWPAIWRQFIVSFDLTETSTGSGDEKVAGILKKIKWPDKVRNLELLGKHISVQAFSDKLDLSSKDGSMSPRGLDDFYADIGKAQHDASVQPSSPPASQIGHNTSVQGSSGG